MCIDQPRFPLFIARKTQDLPYKIILLFAIILVFLKNKFFSVFFKLPRNDARITHYRSKKGTIPRPDILGQKHRKNLEFPKHLWYNRGTSFGWHYHETDPPIPFLPPSHHSRKGRELGAGILKVFNRKSQSKSG